MIKKLRNTCQSLLNSSKKENKKKYELILKILKDDYCFSKMNIEDAYNILEDLKVPKEDIEKTYIFLVSNSLNKIINNIDN